MTFPPVPDEILRLIKDRKRAVVCAHLNPDGDAAYSVMAAGLLLKELGKEYLLVNDGAFSRPEIRGFQDVLSPDVPEDWLSKDTLGIILDCGSPDRTGSKGELFNSFTCIVIDHHSSSCKFSDYSYIVPESPSATLLVYCLFKALNVPLSKEAAQLIFRGFITDSGFFRFLGTGTEEVFNVIADLVRCGVNPSEEYARLNSGRNFLSVSFLGTLIKRTEIFYNGALLISHEEPSDISVYGEEGRSSDGLYRELLSVENAQVVVFFKISNKVQDAIEVGLRASYNSNVDVGAFAAKYGGGGHKKASGFTMKASYEEVRDLVISEMGEFFK